MCSEFTRKLNQFTISSPDYFPVPPHERRGPFSVGRDPDRQDGPALMMGPGEHKKLLRANPAAEKAMKIPSKDLRGSSLRREQDAQAMRAKMVASRQKGPLAKLQAQTKSLHLNTGALEADRKARERMQKKREIEGAWKRKIEAKIQDVPVPDGKKRINSTPLTATKPVIRRVQVAIPASTSRNDVGKVDSRSMSSPARAQVTAKSMGLATPPQSPAAQATQNKTREGGCLSRPSAHAPAGLNIETEEEDDTFMTPAQRKAFERQKRAALMSYVTPDYSNWMAEEIESEEEYRML